MLFWVSILEFEGNNSKKNPEFIKFQGINSNNSNKPPPYRKKKRVVSPPNQSPETDPNLEGDGVLNCFVEKSSRLRLRKCEGI